jgi:hypothetical protein
LVEKIAVDNWNRWITQENLNYLPPVTCRCQVQWCSNSLEATPTPKVKSTFSQSKCTFLPTDDNLYENWFT